MSSRKSKKRIGSTRQRHQVQKAEERGANEELQEASTAQHLQLSNSSETPTCQLDCVPENVEGGQHDSSKTHSENFETGALADITEAETSTSGKKRRMGSTRRAKQGLQAEETKEQEEVKSMQVVQEEFNVTGTEDQYFKEYSDAPELASDQAQTQMPELGGSEVKELGTGDESPNKQHKLLSELDHKTVTEACRTEMHSPPVPFIQSPTPVANTPVCVTGSHPEEGETHSDDTPLQNTPQELSDQQKVESAKDVSKGEEKMGAKEVQGLEGSLSQEIIMQIEKKDDEPVNEMEVESAGIQDFLLQMQDMTQKSALSSTVEKEHSQIFHPSDADIDGTVTESYNKFGNQNIIGSEQTSSIDVSQEEDENSKYNVQRLKKRMGSTRRPLKAIKPKEDIGNSQVGTQEIRDNTLQEEMSVKEDTQFREMVEFNDKLEMAFTVNVRGGELEGTGDEHTAMATEACPSTENITDGIGTSTTSSHLIMERDLNYHHNETDSEERTSIDQEEGAEVLHPGVLGEQISEHLSYHALDEETLQIVDQGQYTENTQLTPEFTTQYVDQLQQHGEINSENSLETPGRQERQSSINMEVSEQTELENKLSSPSDNSSPDSAGITIENIGVTDKTFTDYLSSQVGFGTLSEASGHSEQDHLSPSPTPHAIPESTVAQLNVHAESFISEIYSPNVQHSEEAEQGTQAHILSFTMESEVPNVSTDVPEFSHSLHVVSTDPSEASTLSDHSQSSLKLQHQEEEESVEQSASRQKKRMGSTRRTKREQKREDACGTMTTDDVSEDMDMNMNIDTDMKSEAEEGILPESIKGASKQDEFFTNQTDVVTLSMPLTTAGRDQYVDSSSSAEIVASSLPQCNPEEGGQRQENQDQYPAVIAEQLDGNELDDNKISILGKETAEVITTVGADLSSDAFMKDVDQVKKHEEEMSESFLEVLGDQNKENINAEASEQAESENISSSPTEDPSPDCAGTAVEDMDTSEKAVSFSCQIGVETLTCPGSPPSPSSDHIPEKDTSLNVHAESSNPENPDVQHSEEADPGTQAHILSSTMESEVANISTDVPDFSHSLHVESIGPSETSTLSSHLESSFKLQHQKEEESVQQGASRQKKRMGSTRRTKREQKKEEACGTMSTDEVNEINIDTEITVAPLDVHAENSSPEMHSPDVQHSEEVEQGTQAHILSSTMESEVPNISTAVPDFSHSLHVESTDPSEASTLSDHSQSSLKLQHQEEEESVQQGASRQKKRMGSTRRTKREQKKEETCEAMSTDDVNEEMNMNIDIDMKSEAEEGILPESIIGASKEDAFFTNQTDVTPAVIAEQLDGNELEDYKMSILGKETAEVITTVGADLSSEAFMKDVDQVKKHEEEMSESFLEVLGDQNKENINAEASEQAESENILSSPTEDPSPDCAGTAVGDMDTSEKAVSFSCQIGVETLTCPGSPLSPSSDPIPEKDTSLNVHAESSNPENPDVQHSEEADPGTQAHILSSTMESEVPNISTDVPGFSHSLHVESIGPSETTTLSSHLESSFKLQHQEEEESVQQGASRQKKRMGSTRRTKREQKKEETCEAMSTDEVNEINIDTEITVAPLDVHAENSSPEMHSPDVQHSEEVEQGTQAHILSPTMESEVPNISTDVPDFSHSLHVESTDPSEASTLSDHSQSSLKLQHQEEEESVQQGASRQKKRMGSTRRTKREQKREETCEAMSTDDVNEEMNMNIDIDMKSEAEEGILPESIIGASKEDAFFTNQTDIVTPAVIAEQLDGNELEDNKMSILGKERAEAITTVGAGLSSEAFMKDVDQVKKHEEEMSESFLEVLGDQNKENINAEASEQAESENILSSPTEDPSPDCAGTAVEDMDTSEKAVSFSCQIGVETLTCPGSPPSPSSDHIPEKDTSLNVHAESSNPENPDVQHSEEADPGTQAHILSSTMESEVANISTDVPDFSHSLHVESIGPSETSTLSSHLESSFKLQHQEEEESVQQGASRQKKRMGSTRRTKREQKKEEACGTMSTDEVNEMNIDTEITVAPLDVIAESSSPEMHSPDVQHSEEAEPGTQAHILSSTMESEVPNISTDVPDFSHSLHVESTDPSEASTLSDHSQSSLKLQHQEEEESVQQGASRQKKRMGSTHRTKREQKKEETCEAMSTDDVNEEMNMNIDIGMKSEAEEGILPESIIGASKEDAFFTNQTDIVTPAVIAEQLDGNELEDKKMSILGKETAEVITTVGADLSSEAFMKDVDQVKKHEEEMSESFLEVLGDQNKENINAEASEQAESENMSSSPTEDPRPDCAGTAVGDMDTSEKAVSFSCQIGVETLTCPGSPPSPSSDPIPEKDTSLNVHAESSNPENPDVQHNEEADPGTQAHILSSTMESEVPNISTDVPDFSHSLHVESIGPSETSTLSSHLESSFKLQHQEEEESVQQGASRQKKRMGSTRRTKREQKKEETGGTMSTDEVNEMNIDTEITVAPLDVHAENSSPEMHSPDVQHSEEVEQGTQAHILSPTMESEVPNISTDVPDFSHSLHVESTDPSETSTLSDHSQSSLKLQHQEEEESVQQDASRQKKRMGSTRRTKREQKKEETCEAMSTDDVNEEISMNIDIDMKSDIDTEITAPLNVHAWNSSPEMHSPDVQHSEETEQGTQAHIDGNYLEDNNDMSILEKETREVITTVGADLFSEAFMREDVNQLKKHEEEQSGKSHESLFDPKENRISTELSEQAEVESKQSYTTEDLSADTTVEGMDTMESPSESHTWNMESSNMAESRAAPDHWESTLRLQPVEKEGDLEPDVSRHKRKMGSTRRQKRESNEVHLDGTRSSQEVMTVVVTETDIEVQLEENLQSEQISSSENIHAACLNTIPVGFNECQMKDASKETVDEPNKQDINSQESEKEKGEKDILMIQEGKVGEHQREVNLGPPETHRAIQDDTMVKGQGRILEQIQNIVTETSVSASQYPQTEESPGLKRRRKLGSTRRSQREKTERKYVVMDGMLIHSDSEASPCRDSKSVEVEGKDEVEGKIHDIEENTEAMSCIFVNTIVIPSTPESLETNQERSNDDIHSIDEVTKEQCILASTITTAEQPPLENIAGNDNYSAHGDTLTVNSDTPPANSPSYENTLKLSPLENCDSSEESKPQKKRMGSSRKISQRQHKDKKSSHGEADVKNEDSDSVTNTVTEPIQQIKGDLCAEHIGGLEGVYNDPEDHLVREMYVQSPLGQIEVSESSETTAVETTSSNLCEDDSQKEPKSMLQKRKMGSSRRGQGLKNKAKQAANVEDVDDISTSKKEGNDTALQNTEDLSMEGEQLLITSVQTSKSNLQPLAQAERPDELIDERVLSASAQCRTSVHSVSSSPSSELQEDNPSIDPKSTTKKRKMGSTRKNMRRQGEDEKSNLKKDQESAERCNVIDDMGDLTGAMETVTIQKVTETGESEDTLPQDEGSGHGSAGHKEVPEGTRRKMGSRRGGPGCRGIGVVRGPEDQPVSQGPENDSSVLQNTQENVNSEGVPEQGLSKLVLAGEGQFQKVEQPPSGARSKSDLDRKYGQDYTLTSLEEAVMFNVVMVGDSSVGKTSFIRRFQSGEFNEDHSATIGVDSYTQTLAVDGELVKLQIWDTAGQERFHSITRNVLHKAHGLILMYDISSCHTFTAVRKWITCIEDGAPSEVIILLLGNKNDSEDRQVLHPEGERLAQEYKIHFMECSAATGDNISQSIETLARLLKQTVKESGQGNVTLHKKPPQKKAGCC